MFILRKPFWAPADEGGAGSGQEGAIGAGGAAGGDGSSTGEGGPPLGGDGGEAGAGSPKGSSILDYAPKGEVKGEGDKGGGEGGEWKLPDGLEVPDHLLGKDADETLKKLSTAYKGARQELSTRKREDGVLEGEVPKDLDGYTFDGDTENDPILKDLTSEESKPIVDAWRKAALEVGIPNAAFAKFMHAGIKQMQDGGLNIALNGEEAARINGEAELDALTQALGKDGADTALRQLDTFAQKLANNGILQDQRDVDEYGQMVGTARAAQIMQRIISAEFGERAIPPADPINGAPTLAEAYETHARALKIENPSDRQQAVAAAEEQIQKALRQGSTQGQVRSRVL